METWAVTTGDAYESYVVDFISLIVDAVILFFVRLVENHFRRIVTD